MKYTHCFLVLAASAAFVSITGCSKQESATKETQTASTPANPEKPTTIDTAAAVQATKQAVEQSVTQTVAAAHSTMTNTRATAQSTVETQKLALAQAVTNQVQALATSATNQFQALATAATNQFQALATAATNRVLTTLGITNHANPAITNQVEALLEKTKMLSSNQNYQEALGTVTELYKNKLTPEQKLRVDALKTEIQTALAQKATEGASSALGGLLRGKKE